MENEAYLRTIRTFKSAQAQKGEGGCFAELYQVLECAANKLNILRSFLDAAEYTRRMSELEAIAKGLPDLHDPEVLRLALQKVAKITTL